MEREICQRTDAGRTFLHQHATPTDGTIALVQEESGWIGFALFLGEKFDVGSTKIVPIGRVAKGREIVQKILESPSRDGRLIKPIEIRRVIRNE